MKMEWEIKARLAKPCPFCGSRNVITENREHFDESGLKTCTYIECDECGAIVHGMPVWGADMRLMSDYNTAQREVLKVWNRRAAS